MIHSVTVTNYQGDQLYLELAKPYDSGLAVRSIDGLGPMKATINTTSIATTDGSLFNSSRAQERNIVISLKFLAGDDYTVEDSRHKTYKYFPLKKELTFVVETDNRTCGITGYVESNEPDIFSDDSGCQISIICPQPYFTLMGSSAVQTCLFSGVESAFEFPFENNSLTENLIEFGTIVARKENLLTYYGDGENGITIIMHSTGTVKNVTIYNVGTRESMKLSHDRLVSFTGSGIVAGDTITISTIKGYKSVELLRDGVTTNILSCMGKNDDWLQISKGENIFAFTCEEGSDFLNFSIEYTTLYEGA